MTENKEHLRSLRREMVESQIVARGVSDELVIDAMLRVPRHEFVPPRYAERSYSDEAIGIGPEQSISQPYIVALMLSSVELSPAARVLDVGTGSGYQTALLAEIVKDVYTIEIDPMLLQKSRSILERLNYKNINYKADDGNRGWPEAAPFDVIVVSAACQNIPRDLVKQLKEGGRLILPLGDDVQYLVLIKKTPDGLVSSDLGAVQFVPMQEGK